MLPNGFYRDFSGVDSGEIEFVCYGIMRSGSTLVYQLISGLYRSGVVKTHTYCPCPVKKLASYRDFRDVAVSLWRVNDPQNVQRRMTPEEVDSFGQRCQKMAGTLERYRLQGDVCMLRYEDFVRDPRMIFEELERRFGVVVPRRKADRLVAAYSLERNRRRAAELGRFSRHDPRTQIHGNHIHTGEPGSWRSFVTVKDAKRLEDMLAPWLERYGYPREARNSQSQIADSKLKAFPS